MEASSSTNSNYNDSNVLFVDDFYFSALFDYEEEIFPVSDELYAEELHLQEALMSSSALLFSAKIKHVPTKIKREPSELLEEENSHNLKGKNIEIGESSETHQGFCEICRDSKAVQEMFTKANCTHIYCNDCIASYIASKIQENVAKIKCPDMRCVAILDPHLCHQIIPKQVFSRWENVLSKAFISGSQMVYCPFKDCGAVMVDDGVDVTESECASCHRLFCGRCNVPWHAGMHCKEYQRLGTGERVREDLMMMELATKKKWRKCPQWKVYVEKIDGCLHISCRCGSEFCYGCGAAWSTVHQCSRI